MTFHTIHPDLLTDRVRVALVGAGGNGSQMLTGLARLHLALLSIGHPGGLHVTLYDPDRVSESNIGRQLFYPPDIGQYKACVLVHRLNCAFGLDWEARPHRFTMPAYYPHILDMVISCVDTIRSRKEIEGLLRERNTSPPHYWLDMGNRQVDGQVILGFCHSDRDRARVAKGQARLPSISLPNVLEVFPQLKRRTREDETPSCSLAEALEKQDLFVNDHVTRWALHLLWTLFRQGKIEHHGYFINLVSGTVNPLPVPGGKGEA